MLLHAAISSTIVVKLMTPLYMFPQAVISGVNAAQVRHRMQLNRGRKWGESQRCVWSKRWLPWLLLCFDMMMHLTLMCGVFCEIRVSPRDFVLEG